MFGGLISTPKKQQSNAWFSFYEPWRRVTLIALLAGFIAYVAGILLEKPSGQTTAYDLIAYPIMAIVMVVLEITLLLHRQSLRFVVLVIVIGVSTFFLTKLCYIAFVLDSALQMHLNLAETFWWLPCIFLFCFLVPGVNAGRIVAAIFSVVFLLISVVYALFIGIHIEAWGVMYTLIQVNLANVVQLSLAYTFISFKEKYAQVSDRVKSIEKVAYKDSLTSLPNRLALHEKLNYFITQATLDNTKLAILFIDLDNFKFVNDTLGHEAGDLLLIKVAQHLQNTARQNDFVGRISGDEFVLIAQDIESWEAAQFLAQRLQASFVNPFSIAEQSLTITASIGISLFPDHGQNTKTLLKHSDSAMYYVKNSGKNGFKLYEDKADAKVEMRRSLEKDLHTALAEDQFELYYQPIFDLQSSRMVKAEVLLRWHNPNKGWVSPSDFIPIAEESGLIMPLGKQVLQKACQQAKKWQQQGWEDFNVAVNVSAIQFAQPNFFATVVEALEVNSLLPEYLELEVTESVVLQWPNAVAGTLLKLQRLGVTIALDDFGTGYSSLAYLRDLPLDCVKIDRSFIKDLSTPRQAPQFALALIEAVINLARCLDIQVVAEGIGASKQKTLLMDLGCHLGQGYYFAKPMPANSLTSLIPQTKEEIANLFKTVVN